jgi:hypothetical protein
VRLERALGRLPGAEQGSCGEGGVLEWSLRTRRRSGADAPLKADGGGPPSLP